MDRFSGIMRVLGKHYPGFNRKPDPFRVLVSTVLSQRNRDESTYPAAEKLFRRFGSAKKLASAGVSEIEGIIHSIGLYRTKARRIKEISRILIKKYKGRVPDDLYALLALPGVGRKTANCVLVYAFKKPAIPVDTHVHRVSNRLGIVRTKTPEQTEEKLAEVIPRKYWISLNELFVQHGQKICRPISPRCGVCMISAYCGYYRRNYKK